MLACVHTFACTRAHARACVSGRNCHSNGQVNRSESGWVTSRRRVGGEGACSHGGLRYRATRSGGTYGIVGCLLSDTSWKGSVRDMTSGLDPPPTSPPTRRRLVHGVEGGVASIDRSGGGGGGISIRDNSDTDAVSELQHRCRGCICGARAGVGLRNGGLIGPRGQIERFGGKLACWSNYEIMQNWSLHSPRRAEHACTACSVRAWHPD